MWLLIIVNTYANYSMHIASPMLMVYKIYPIGNHIGYACSFPLIKRFQIALLYYNSGVLSIGANKSREISLPAFGLCVDVNLQLSKNVPDV